MLNVMLIMFHFNDNEVVDSLMSDKKRSDILFIFIVQIMMSQNVTEFMLVCV